MKTTRRSLAAAPIVTLSIAMVYTITSFLGCSGKGDSPDGASDPSASSTDTDPDDAGKGHAGRESRDPAARERLLILAMGSDIDLDTEPDPVLQGSWKLARVYERLEGGSQEYLEVSSKYEMTIEGRHVTVEAEFAEGEETQHHEIYVGRRQELNTYILDRTDIEGAEATQFGIYQISQGRLQFCFQETGGFPEAFVVPGGGDRLMFEFERIDE